MKAILLIGLNHFGTLLARQLYELGHEIMAVDRNEERVNDILPFVTDAQIGDSTNEAFLRSLGINNYDVCIVTIGEDFQSSLETTSLLKDLGGKLVVSRADREPQARFLLKNGADEVINPEKQVAEWAAIRYGSDHILDYIVGQIDIRKQYGINIMAVKENGRMNLSVKPETMLGAGKTMLVLGESDTIRKYFRM